MNKIISILTILMLALAFMSISAFAQEEDDLEIKTFPGEIWHGTGSTSPIEDNNVISSTFIEQGVALKSWGRTAIVPFGRIQYDADTLGLDWNNRALLIGGLKLVSVTDHSRVQVGFGYAQESRLKSETSAGHPHFFANIWSGWDQPYEEKSDFPGQTYISISNPYPTEGNNVIGTFMLDQGVTVARAGDVSIIPFGSLTVNVDSKQNTWNNRALYGFGGKVGVPLGSGILYTGVMHQFENRWITSERDNGLAFFVNMWYGWSR